jgi:phage shock protein A
MNNTKALVMAWLHSSVPEAEQMRNKQTRLQARACYATSANSTPHNTSLAVWLQLAASRSLLQNIG